MSFENRDTGLFLPYFSNYAILYADGDSKEQKKAGWIWMNANAVVLVYVVLLVICALLGILSGSVLARKYKSPRKTLWRTGGGLVGVLIVFPLILKWLSF